MTLPYDSTVTEAAESPDLTTLETVKEELGLTSATATDDAILVRMITAASEMAAKYCRRQFVRETMIDSFRLDYDSDLIVLSRRPVVSIVSIVDDGETLVEADYEVQASTGHIWRLDGDDARQDWAAGKIVITHTSGYLLGENVPADLERAVIAMVKQAWFAKASDPTLRSENILEGLYAYTRFDQGGGLPDDIAVKLNPYVNMHVA